MGLISRSRYGENEGEGPNRCRVGRKRVQKKREESRSQSQTLTKPRSRTETKVVQPKDLTIAIPDETSLPPKRQRRSSPLALSKDKGKAPQTLKMCLALKDSASVLSEPNQVTDIMDSLMTRHDRVILKGMTFEDISHEAKQCALKVAQNCRFLAEAVIKADNACKKRMAALNKLTATNKSLEEEVQGLKQIAADAVSETEQVASERDDLQTREAEWLRKKRIVYRKGVEDAFLKARREMIRRFKAGETNWPTPELSEISSKEDEAEDDAEGEQNNNNQPKDPPLAPKKSHSPTKDSFIKAMEQVQAERIGPSVNAGEASSSAQPNQGDLP
ncbi:hypothetical protein FNV43_RR15471 [Rhamnella rubrinervis]|uniref:Uncharacterized protein n=1 Tax=Rhamnella rubrinervis TaxID=2594499 RepID=A0A8K0E1L6_9ROSA|nr:hypothetical protein FNV43_RR15471 [Rhamnella rubrinervis]